MFALGLAALVAFTSVAAWATAGRGGRSGLRPALWATLEAIGLATLFLMGNVGLAATLVLAGRGLGAGFVSVYVSDDVTLLGASLLQGVAVRLWLLAGSGGRPRRAEPGPTG